MKNCPSCGRDWHDKHRFCPEDGTALLLAAGTILGGRYEVERVLGRGGMGIVYRGRQLPPVARPCAIKVLHIRAGSQPGTVAEAVERLCQEAGVLAGLGPHPNLVAVYDAARDDNGLTWVAMEYVDGESLKEKLADGVVYSEERIARILELAAAGIDYVHRQDIIHRDLKPGNLMLTREADAPGWVKVVDFGIAKALGPSEYAGLTKADVSPGTNEYMSPEQRQKLPLDPRSDIYSLALIAVELLADARPSPRLTGDGRAVFESMERARTWSEETKQILARALATEPSERFDSATELAEALAASIAAPTPSAAAVDPPARRSPFARRSTLAAAGTLAIAGLSWWVISGLGRGLPTTPVEPVPDTVQEPIDTITGPAPVPDSAEAPPPDPTPPPDTATPPQPDTATPGPEERPPVEPGPDYAAALRALQELVNLDDPDSLALVTAVDDAALLLGDARLPDSTRVEVSYLTAEARMMLGRREAGCADLRRIEVQARTDPWVRGRYARAVQTLLDLHCTTPG